MRAAENLGRFMSRRGIRPWLERDHAGFATGTAPHRVVLTATVSVALVIKLADSPYRPSAFAAGPHDSYAVMDGVCAPSYLEARLSPLGAYTLLGLPLHELRRQIVDLADLLDDECIRMVERIREAPQWRRRFELLDELLMRRIAVGPRPAPEMVCAWRRIQATAGSVEIHRVADEVGWSHRHLIAMFKRHIGVPPRTAARIVRFENVLQRIEQRAPSRWVNVAADLAYADQAHLIRDFKGFTGTTPTEFETAFGVNSVQDRTAAPV